jgi:hypothetical protein
MKGIKIFLLCLVGALSCECVAKAQGLAGGWSPQNGTVFASAQPTIVYPQQLPAQPQWPAPDQSVGRDIQTLILLQQLAQQRNQRECCPQPAPQPAPQQDLLALIRERDRERPIPEPRQTIDPLMLMLLMQMQQQRCPPPAPAQQPAIPDALLMQLLQQRRTLEQPRRQGILGLRR